MADREIPDGEAIYGNYIPTEEEIAAACRAIRAKWSDVEERRRQVADRPVDYEVPEVEVDDMGLPEIDQQ